MANWVPPIRAGRFLSTPSARRATFGYHCSFGLGADFYPRPPRGGRRQLSQLGAVAAEISIHALREEGDRVVVSDAG